MNINRILITVVLFFYFIPVCTAQWVVDTLAYVPEVSEHEVNFLFETPLIDGILDKSLEFLPVRQFGFISLKTQIQLFPLPTD